MREVSVRMLHFQLDLAKVAGIDKRMLTEGLPSVAMADGNAPGDAQGHVGYPQRDAVEDRIEVN